MNHCTPYLPPAITILDFHVERGYTSSSNAPMEHVDQFQLMINEGGQQEQRTIEQFNYHDQWGETGDEFFQ